MRRWPLILGALAVLALAVGGPLYAALDDDTRPEQQVPPLDAASAAGQRFIERYVDPDGRVVRRDQDNDTVSEGQAYAMLVAVAIGDRTTFDRTWNWARQNLLQPSGLMAWVWKDGRIVDPQPASDADLDAARALSLGAERFDNPQYAEQGRALAKAIVDNELAYDNAGRPILVAGPWAREAPFVTNPSYHSPRAEVELARLTSDTQWNNVLVTQRELLGQLLGKGDDGNARGRALSSSAQLPPDWASVTADGVITPTSPPGKRDIAARYSYDAIRTPIRLAESCDPADVAQAAQMWNLLNRSRETRTSAIMSLDGNVIGDRQSAVAAVGAAAAAHGAKDTNQVMTLLDLADRLDTNNNSYYGAAWAALGRIMLTTNWLGVC